MWSAETRTIRKAKAGDHAAFAKLYDRYASFVYRPTSNATTAEYLTQETFLAAYQSPSNWRGEGKFSTRLCGIAFRQYAGSRRRILLTEALDDSMPSVSFLDDPWATLSRREAEKALELAIADLPDLCGEVYVLVRVEGMSYKDAAAVLESPIGTVQSRLWRASRSIQAALTPLLFLRTKSTLSVPL